MKKITWLILTVLLVGCGSPDEKVDQYVANANKHIAAGDYQAAHIEFRNALKINPNHVDALYSVTKVFEHRKEYAKSHRYLKRVLELDPSHVDAILAIGTIELASQQLEKAVDRGETAARLAPQSAKVKAYNAVVRLKLGDLKRAVSEAQGALDIDSNNLEAIIVLGSERLLANEPTEAISALNRYQGQSSIALELMKVQAYNNLKDLDGAVNVFESLIKAEEKEEYFYFLVKQYLSFNKNKLADETFKRLLDAKPADQDAKLRYIDFLKQHMGEGRAVAQLKSFIELDPTNLRLNFGLVDIYKGAGHTKEAQEVLIGLTDLEDKEGKVKAFNLLARLEFAAANFEKGDQYLKKALELDSKSQDAIVTGAQRKLQLDEIDQAVSELRSVLRDSPNSAIILGLLGNAHERQGKLELALDQYSKANTSDPNNRVVVIAYTNLMKRQGLYDQIEKVLDRYLLTVPSDVEILQLAAENKLALRNWSDAQLIADRLDKLQKAPVFVDQVRGAAYLGEDNTIEGIAAFERAYEISEDKSRSMAVLVRSYLSSGQKEKAVKFLDDVLKNDTNNLMAINLRAQLHQVDNEMSDAERLYLAAVEAHPDNLSTYQQLSAFWMRQNYPEKVIGLLKEIDSKVAENPSLLLIRAGAYENSGDKRNAIKSYDDVLSIQPELDVAANNLAVLLSENTEYQDLVRAKELALRFRQSEVPFYQDTLGWIYYKTGDYNNALYFHENAVQAMPEMAELRFHLGMSYKGAGESEKAKVELEKAIQLAGGSKPIWQTEAQQALDNL